MSTGLGRESAAQHRRIVADLKACFGEVAHDLWSGETLNAAPTRHAFLKSIRVKQPDPLTNGEIDCITFASLTTMGGVATLKFILPSFFAAYFAKPQRGWAVDPQVIMEKYQLAGIDAWPSEEQLAALQALAAFTESERSLAAEDAKSWSGETDQELDTELAQVAAWVNGRLGNLRRPAS